MKQQMAAILPCNDIETAQAFFARLGFTLDEGSLDDYRILSDGLGGHLHLSKAVQGWLIPGNNPFGLYLYRQDVAGVAKEFAGEIVEPEGPSIKPWGMLEFSLNGPDDTLVRIGWPA